MDALTLLALFLFFIAIVLVLGFIVTYNSILKSKQLVEEARSGIDTQLKKRYDLIPNLIEAVKGYSGYEKALLEKVTMLRSNTVNENNISKKASESDELTSSLKNIFAIAENYPDLKANQNFLELQKNLTETEDGIQYARRYYNGTVREFNIRIISFPSNIVASIIKTPKEMFFEATNEEKENVGVNLS